MAYLRETDSVNPSNTVFVFGLGYVGLHLADRLATQGWHIIGTTRTPEKLSIRQAQGWTILPFSDTQPIAKLSDYLARTTHLISTIGPISGQDPVLAAHQTELAKYTGWTGYLSATSVYPDQSEGWVDEQTPPAPATQRGIARLKAEQDWSGLLATEIFRIAGIYGPKRNPFSALQDGTARIIDKPGHLFNRIHQTDITKIIMSAMAQPRPGRIINLADEKPASQADVIGYAAALLGIEAPKPIPFEQAELSKMARSFYVARRKIRSNIIEPELGIKLSYPDYQTGLDALYKDKKA